MSQRIMWRDPAPRPTWAGLEHAEHTHQTTWERGTCGYGVRPIIPAPKNVGSLHVRTTPYGEAFTDLLIASEVYRAHTQPHLYFEDQIDLIDDNWVDLIGGRRTRDCHTCKRAVVLDDVEDACPTCGGE